MFRLLNPKYGRKYITYKTVPLDLTKHDTDNRDIFVFGKETTALNKRIYVTLFVDKVITKAPVLRGCSRRRQRDRQNNRERRPSLLGNRRSAVETIRASGLSNDSVFALHENQTNQPHNVVVETGNLIVSGGPDEIEDEAIDYNSTSSLDIDFLIDMMNSDESTIDSDSETTEDFF